MAGEFLRRELDKQGVTDNTMRAMIAAVVGGESGFEPKSETPYNKTANSHIRSTFKTALGDRDDAFIDQLKADPEAFFNHVYGPEGAGPDLGNTEDGDGYRFRGRGEPQLTGRSNYQVIGHRIGVDLLEDPDRMNDPEVSAAATVAYALWRYRDRGNGFDDMKSAWGNSIGAPDKEKDRLFELYSRTGEFDYQRSQTPADLAASALDAGTGGTMPADVPKLSRKVAVMRVQQVLVAYGLDTGGVDGIDGKKTKAALRELFPAV